MHNGHTTSGKGIWFRHVTMAPVEELFRLGLDPTQITLLAIKPCLNAYAYLLFRPAELRRKEGESN